MPRRPHTFDSRHHDGAHVRGRRGVHESIDDRVGAILATIPGVPPRSLPSTVILDRQGRVAVRIIGPVKPGQLEQALDTLVAEPV